MPVYVGAALVVSVLLTSVLVTRDRQRILQETEERARGLAVRLDQELARRAFVVDALAAHAESLWAMPSVVLPPATDHLRPHGADGGFTLELPPGARPEEWGDLTGVGGIPTADSRRGREMALALALTPAFHATTTPMPSQPWVHYFSRDGFVYLYPRTSPEEVGWSSALAAGHFSLRGEPLTGFERRVYWSPLYVDQGGKGLLATASRPVFDGDVALGTVNVDIDMQTLLDLLSEATEPLSRLELLNADGVAVELGPSRGGPTTSSQDAGEEKIDIALESAWTLRVYPDTDAILLKALEHSVPYVAFLILIAGGMVLAFTLRRALAHVELLSIRDGLTGVFNRRHFDDVFAVETARARRGGRTLGLALIDVDHFKAFNDRYGHHSGDETLRAVARALQGALRRAGDQVFRIGGEEFAVLVDVQAAPQMEALGERLREQVWSLERRHEGSPFGRVTVSVGVTLVQAANGVDKETAYRRVDAALYQAKAAGRDRVHAA